ncbi:MAG: hypothetical protein ACREJQ_04925 [bacterium]
MDSAAAELRGQVRELQTLLRTRGIQVSELSQTVQKIADVEKAIRSAKTSNRFTFEAIKELVARLAQEHESLMIVQTLAGEKKRSSGFEYRSINLSSNLLKTLQG